MEKLKFSLYGIINTLCFAIAFGFIMFNTLCVYLIIPALVFIIIGITMLIVSVTKRYKLKKREMEYYQEEIIMELSSTEEGQKYIEKPSYAKKMKKRLRGLKWENLTPLIALYVANIIFFALLVKFIANLI